MRRFFIDPHKIIKSKTTIKGNDAKHIINVLRLTPGRGIELFDGAGQHYEAEITNTSQGFVEIKITSSAPSRSESPVQIFIAQAFLKDKKMDRLVRQLTELGITQLFPLLTERSVSRPDAKRLSARIERWNKIATESLKQCRRGRIPKIGPQYSFDDALTFSKSCDLKMICWENGITPIDASFLQPERVKKSIFLIMGPEGGFSSAEITKAKKAGFVIVSLGPRILKAETASVAACTIIQYLFGDMGHNMS